MAAKKKASISELIKKDMSGRFTESGETLDFSDDESGPQKPAAVEPTPRPPAPPLAPPPAPPTPELKPQAPAVPKPTAPPAPPTPGPKPQTPAVPKPTQAVPKSAGASNGFFTHIEREIEAEPLFTGADKQKYYEYMLDESKRWVHSLRLSKENGFSGKIKIMSKKNVF
jgi:hypothetical protein